MSTSSIPVLALENLSIAYRDGHTKKRVVHDVSLTVNRGEVVALVGESGSGKTTTAQAIIGLLAENGERETGRIIINGVDITQWAHKRLDGLRGKHVSLIPQDPGSSLNPVQTIGTQVGEILQLHERLSRKERDARVLALLTRVGLNHPEQRARQYPHELSGGMKQRVLIAIAVALQPELIIADEPTSALDVTVQKRILDLVDELRVATGTAVLFVTHDLSVAAARSDRIVVLRQGEIVEQGDTKTIIRSPKHAYTRKLFEDSRTSFLPATPAISNRGAAASAPAIEITGLSKLFSIGGKGTAPLRAVDQVSFSVPCGTTHALVGESGSGKTTLARMLMGFQKPDAGTILVEGMDVSALRGESLRLFRRKIQLVYQNPFTSLDPSQTVFQLIEEPLLNFDRPPKAERQRQVEAVTERVALPLSVLQRKPRALSGGQRQRVAIARALILNPAVLVLDEATSALDVTVQAQILSLLFQLQQKLGLTYLFITHDLDTVRKLAHTVSVLHAGQQVDFGATTEVFQHPGSDYTRELILAIPEAPDLHAA
ncbi:dipeptide ABC transporter ATP-binding protein [Caballeronia sp. LjRoot31]|uniref:dipeptide ABC transporter ATP-binding protein n=1 Tax=Caballeronia sp. LjRoot31 TaxID=3342324 RepID=UPI003ECD6B56